MYQSRLLKSLFLVATFTLSGTTWTAAAIFQDPATASWGGWERTTEGTASFGWDVFSYDLFSETLGGVVIDNTPDISNYGDIMNMPILIVSPDANIEDETGDISIMGDIAAFRNNFEVSFSGEATLALQLSVNAIDDTISLTSDSFEIQDISAATDIEFIADDGDDSGHSGLFLMTASFDNISAVTYLEYQLNVEGGLILKGTSIDIGPAPVPVPAALPLLGSALIGLVGLNRRRRS